MKYLLLFSVSVLAGCSSLRTPEVIYIEQKCPKCDCSPFDVDGQPHLLGLTNSPVAVIELNDGKVLSGTVSVIRGVTVLVTSFECRRWKVGCDAIKSITFLSPTNSLPEHWQELPGARIWQDAEPSPGGDGKPAPQK